MPNHFLHGDTQIIRDQCNTIPVPSSFGEDNLHTAMTIFDLKGIEEIPVVEATDNRWVVGMLRRRDVLARYNREIVTRGISEKSSVVKMK